MIGETVAAEAVEDVDVATAMEDEAAEAVTVAEEDVEVEDEIVEEAVGVTEEDADVVEEEESRKASMSRTRTPSHHCR